MIISIR